jgi:LemA protein
MVHAKNLADTAFSTIDVMLKKRWDLIPNLVDAAQRYIEHEEGVLQEVTRLRSLAAGDLPPDEAVELDNQLRRGLRQLFATAEAYPELKADQHFQQLQRAVNEVEEQLSAARRAFNMSVKQYNDAVRMLPTNLIARVLGWRERAYFELAAGEGERPDVMERFRAHQG